MSKLRLYLAKNGSRCLSFVNFYNLYFELLEPVKNLRLNEKTKKKLTNCISKSQRKNPVKPQKSKNLAAGDPQLFLSTTQ